MNNVGFFQYQMKNLTIFGYWMFRSDDKKLEQPSVLAFMTFAFILMHFLVKPNSQSEFSLNGCRSNMLNRPKSHRWGLTSASGAEHTTKTSLTDALRWPDVGRWSAWCVMACIQTTRLICRSCRKYEQKKQSLSKNCGITIFIES